MVKVAEAKQEDLKIVHELAHKIWPDTFKEILSPQQIEYMLEWMYSITSLENQANEKGHSFLLAKDNEQYIGYASYQLNCESNRTKLHKIYVLPEQQGKGIGKILLQEIIAKALEGENKKLFLNVNKHNKAVNFYEKNGFKIIDEEDIPIGNGYYMNDYVMELELSNR